MQSEFKKPSKKLLESRKKIKKLSVIPFIIFLYKKTRVDHYHTIDVKNLEPVIGGDLMKEGVLKFCIKLNVKHLQ